jgi:pyruvate/2-oxoglutarate dehydrogenase complex dihydrolipoamide dehydrogenase (E3) component
MATCPRRLAIIGGGHIGCEFASIYRTLGCEVTLIERKNRLLSAWEPEASERVAGTLENRGVVLRLNQEISSGQIMTNQSCIRISLPNQESIDADLVLFATGRLANSTNLGLQELGVDDTWFLNVDTQMRLPRAGLYAVGDVNGISLLDSTAFAQANIAVRHILGHSTPFDHRLVPRCIHTDPCVAAVGRTEEDANEEGNEYRTVSDTILLVSDTPRSVIDPEPTFVKVVTDAKSALSSARYNRSLAATASSVPNTTSIAVVPYQR